MLTNTDKSNTMLIVVEKFISQFFQFQKYNIFSFIERDTCILSSLLFRNKKTAFYFLYNNFFIIKILKKVVFLKKTCYNNYIVDETCVNSR